MWVAMSRGRALAVVAATFVAGGAAGWVVRGGGPSVGEPRPALTVREGPRSADGARGFAVPASGAASPVGRVEIKATPTPGHYVRLGPNETLSELAQRAYGTTRRAKELLEANPHLDPRRVPAGTLVYVPLGTEDVAPAPPPVPPSTLPPVKATPAKGAAPDGPPKEKAPPARSAPAAPRSTVPPPAPAPASR